MSADPCRNPAPNSIRVGNAELATTRQVMRELAQLLDRLDAGDVEKLVITQANQIARRHHHPAALGRARRALPGSHR